jgi:hypothetical protein
MRKPVQNTPLISVAQRRSCRLNKAAVRLINSSHGERYKLISFGSETRLLKTEGGEFEVRNYKNEDYSIGGIKLIEQLNAIFPNCRKFLLEPLFDNQYSLRPYEQL